MTAIIAVLALKIYASIGFWLFVTRDHNINCVTDTAVVLYGFVYSFTWPWRKK